MQMALDLPTISKDYTMVLLEPLPFYRNFKLIKGMGIPICEGPKN